MMARIIPLQTSRAATLLLFTSLTLFSLPLTPAAAQDGELLSSPRPGNLSLFQQSLDGAGFRATASAELQTTVAGCKPIVDHNVDALSSQFDDEEIFPELSSAAFEASENSPSVIQPASGSSYGPVCFDPLCAQGRGSGANHCQCTPQALFSDESNAYRGMFNQTTLWKKDAEWLSVGMGLISTITGMEDGAPNRSSWATSFNIPDMRLYMNARLTKVVGFQFNTDVAPMSYTFPNAGTLAPAQNVQVLDAFARFDFNQAFHVYVGRMLVPSTRSEMSGPYFLNAIGFPFANPQYPNVFDGRSTGVTAWGFLADNRFKYYAGMFQGATGAVNPKARPMFATRMVFNFLDTEESNGYYSSSTYYGAKDILALEFSYLYQPNAAGTAAQPRNFSSIYGGGLFEKVLPNDDTLTFQGMYFDATANAATVVGPTPNSNSVATQGKGWFALSSYLFSEKLNVLGVTGQPQVYTRYQQYLRSVPTAFANQDGIDIGSAFILKGHMAKLYATYQRRLLTGAGWKDGVLLGAVLQF